MKTPSLTTPVVKDELVYSNNILMKLKYYIVVQNEPILHTSLPNTLNIQPNFSLPSKNSFSVNNTFRIKEQKHY